MSEFKGGNKVRCSDCSSLSGSKCSLKRVKVSVKKRRICNKYSFKGEYENNTPLPSTYLPHVDKNTRRLLRRLSKMGVMPMSGERPILSAAPYEEEVPTSDANAFKSTATAAIPVVGSLESVGEAVHAEIATDSAEVKHGSADGK